MQIQLHRIRLNQIREHRIGANFPIWFQKKTFLFFVTGPNMATYKIKCLFRLNIFPHISRHRVIRSHIPNHTRVLLLFIGLLWKVSGWKHSPVQTRLGPKFVSIVLWQQEVFLGFFLFPIYTFEVTVLSVWSNFENGCTKIWSTQSSSL